MQWTNIWLILHIFKKYQRKGVTVIEILKILCKSYGNTRPMSYTADMYMVNPISHFVTYITWLSREIS